MEEPKKLCLLLHHERRDALQHCQQQRLSKDQCCTLLSHGTSFLIERRSHSTTCQRCTKGRRRRSWIRWEKKCIFAMTTDGWRPKQITATSQLGVQKTMGIPQVTKPLPVHDTWWAISVIKVFLCSSPEAGWFAPPPDESCAGCSYKVDVFILYDRAYCSAATATRCCSSRAMEDRPDAKWCWDGSVPVGNETNCSHLWRKKGGESHYQQ